MSKATGEEILRLARERVATAITLDADFHAILAVSGAAGPSVVRVRRQGMDAAHAVKANKTTCHSYLSVADRFENCGFPGVFSPRNAR